MFKRVCCLLVILLCSLIVCGQNANYQLFENITPGSGATAINCFIQDSQGLIWVGTNKGLFSYDGYSAQSHFNFDEQSNIQVNCGVLVDSSRLFLGTDNGVLIYNILKDRYEETTIKFPTDVRTMTLQNNILWLGTLNGLYWFDLNTEKLKYFDRQQYRNLPHKTIYSIILSHDDCVYIGTYNGLCSYNAEKDDFRRINLPINRRKNNQFVNSLLEDTIRQCLWIGTEGSLLKYNLTDGKAQVIEDFQDNSIKSLALDGSNRLLIGTDNGLYVYQEPELPQHIIHDSRDLQSLSNNIVWTIFTDREQNIWLGTDHGISLSRCNLALQYIPISQITGSGEGNQLYSLFRDSRGNSWFGGTNGLIRVQPSEEVAWYKMGSRPFPLPHNRIRNIYEDREGELWIATDGSVNRFDYRTAQFVQYTIVDSTGTNNSNWVYYLFEDHHGQLWIATCLGGIFVVDRQKLMQSHTSPYVAEYNYSSANGLSGMFINQIVPDYMGNVWVLLYNNGIDRIDTKTRKVTPVPLEKHTGGRKPNYILCDHSSMIWVGFRGGILCINPSDQRIKTVRFDAYDNTEVLSMLEVEDNIWISTTDGFWVVDKQTLNASRLNLSEKRFSSMFYDEANRSIYLGGVDGIGLVSPDILSVSTLDRPVIATAIYVNNNPLDIKGSSIRYARLIELKYKQNNFSVEFSDLPYSMEEKNKFIYRLEGLDSEWNQLSENTNRISYSNLDYGFYKLVVSKLDAKGKPSASTYTLDIRILPPWYYTILAKSIYLLLFLSLVVWTINFFRMKSRLKIEHIEKEKILEQSRMKIDFFTNLSHEMKTPLSMIIAPVSKIISEIKNPKEAQQLTQVLRNAMNLNSLIHQSLDFNRMDSDANTLLILSRTDLVSLARRLFAVYEEAGKSKELTFFFQTNRESAFMDIDVIKWESILNNLLSNAMKYTPEGGTVTLSLNYREEEQLMDVSVSDTGIGVPVKDIPYIFQRFFQSSKTSGKKEGTGIGLYLVKTYTELHGGKISLSSKENQGTTITVTMPVKHEVTGTVNAAPAERSDLAANVNANRSDVTPSPSAVSDRLDESFAASSGSDRPLVLVVDDNEEISGFIAEILGPYYRCQVAADGKSGLDLCLEHIPDLIISDVMMPVMNGLEMCQLIRKNVPTSTVPIILLTAVDDKATELESIHLNIDAFIAKPFQPDILLSRVNQLINKNQTLEARLRMEAMSTPKEIEAVSYDEKFLSSITRIIEDHLDDSDLNVTALCELSGINNKQIYRKLKQLTGMVPVDYIKSIRMKKAAMLLAQKKFTVAEVMYMVGFSNHSYFSKCFQAEFHKTPMQFREEGEQGHF